MGQQFTRYLLENEDPQKVIIYSRDEFKQAEMEKAFSDKRLRFFIGDVCDEKRLKLALNGVDYVVHTAALKHVDKAEYNPLEYIATNVGGTAGLVRACIDSAVKRCVLLSTDKSCMPINLYGATKMVAEKLFLASCVYKPIFNVVRYGNVLHSRGSVVPYFKALIAGGAKRLPITALEMTRFAVTFAKAIAMIMEALKGDPQVVYVAKAMTFSMAELCDAFDCEPQIVGIRPGEKLHETLIHEYETGRAYDAGSHYRIIPEIPFDGEYQFNVSRTFYKGNAYTSDTAARLNIGELRCLIGEYKS